MAIRLWTTADLVSPLTAPEPNVRSSTRISSPVTIGSGIVLPASYTDWDRKKLRIVLAHERSHVRQMDFYLQLLAGLYTALFWFSPLGWWLRRTLTSLGEAIGDRAGMDAAASGSRYAEVLLEFAALPRQTLPGVAMARPGNLSHRVERLLNEHLFRSAFAEGRRRAVVSLMIIPAALFAATVLIRVPGASAQAAPPPPQAPARRPDRTGCDTRNSTNSSRAGGCGTGGCFRCAAGASCSHRIGSAKGSDRTRGAVAGCSAVAGSCAGRSSSAESRRHGGG